MTESDSIRTVDIEYLRHGDKPLLARLYHPAGIGPFPAIVDIHGGTWVADDRLRNTALAYELARRGTLVMSVDFTMPPEAGFPASLVDINAAIRWLKIKATELNVDRQRIGTLGTSSGGHQALLLALCPNDPLYVASPTEAATDASVGFVVACWPIVDPVQRYAMARAKNRLDLVRGHELFWNSQAAMAQASPQHVLDRNDQTHTPRALLIQGTADDNVDHRTMEPFAEAYRRRGGSIVVRKFEGSRHAFARDGLAAPDAAAAVEEIDRFIRQPDNRAPAAALWANGIWAEY